MNLVFEVFEGKEATIKKVNFINNKIFSDSTLKDVISSSEYRWYEFWEVMIVLTKIELIMTKI